MLAQLFAKSPPHKTIAALLFAIAIPLLILSAGWAAYSRHRTATASRARGHIIQMLPRDGFSYPVFTFADADGHTHTIHSNAGSSPPAFRIGDAITVLYHPGDESNASIDDWITLWGIPLAFLAAGSANLLIALAITFWPRFTKKIPVTT